MPVFWEKRELKDKIAENFCDSKELLSKIYYVQNPKHGKAKVAKVINKNELLSSVGKQWLPG